MFLHSIPSQQAFISTSIAASKAVKSCSGVESKEFQIRGKPFELHNISHALCNRTIHNYSDLHPAAAAAAQRRIRGSEGRAEQSTPSAM